ncbi:ABC transporter substrate-binding protein [Streptomyces sp. NPDC050548]|uniref:ABC transporter substrate-binding protein n=1 Tax=Streptomyces sp. NPDC050548 TaxID=3365629 RepID=UPI0037BA758D
MMTNHTFTRRGALALGGSTFAGLFLAACGGTATTAGSTSGKPVEGGTLTIGLDGEPTVGFDPQVAQAFFDQQIVAQFYEGLLSLDNKGQIKPGLAKSYKQLDATTHQFTLRDGVTFHDGTKLTTDDVIFSLERLMDPAIKSPYTQQYRIKTVTAVDASTVEVKLSAPQPSLYNFLARPWSGAIMSKKWTTAQSANQLKQSENGTGPFSLKKWSKGISITLSGYKGYWDKPKPYLDTVIYRLIPDETSRVASLRSNSVQLLSFRDLRMVSDVKSTSGVTEANGPLVSSVWLNMNTLSGPLADKRVRQAFNLAIDRDTLIKTLGSGSASFGYVIPPQDPYGITPTTADPMYQHNQAKAVALLKAAGKSSVSIELTAPSDSAYGPDISALELMKAQLSKVGITLNLKLVPFASLVPKVLGGDYTDMIMLTSVLNADPAQYLDLWFAKGSPATKVKDQHLWDLMAAAKSEQDNAKRVTLYHQLAQYIADEAYLLVPYAKAVRGEAWSDRLHGYQPDATATRLNLKNAWLTS